MSIASRGATMAVDLEQRVDFDWLRRHRLEQAKASLRDSDLGALLLFDPNNLRYANDRRSAARIEEEVVVTPTGPQILTRFPAQELLVTGKSYVRGTDLVAEEVETAMPVPG